MRIPLTKYGWPQVVVLPAMIAAVMILIAVLASSFFPVTVLAAIEVILTVLLLFVLMFFRDPRRKSPADANLLLAPADGRVMDIETIEKNEHLQGPAIRIGIFLSIFNAHINRAPCDVTVEQINYTKGKFKDARNPGATKVNESNDLVLIRDSKPTDKIIVRQISGAVARHIICAVRPGQRLSGGQKFGMIKFGSRTELYLPLRDGTKCLVKVGDKVKAGLTAIARYE